MHQRRKAREIALQVLYALDLLGTDATETTELYWNITLADPEELFENPLESREAIRQFSTHLIIGTWGHRNEIDHLLARHSEHWSLSRMSRVDKAILRMAIYELQFCDDIPPKVTLNEAIDLGKIFGSENSGSFINGILDAVYEGFRQSLPSPLEDDPAA